jgi:hypothetical protein
MIVITCCVKLFFYFFLVKRLRNIPYYRVLLLCLQLTWVSTEVPGSIPGHSLGFFWGSWVWNGVHSASWSEKLSSYLNKEVTVRFGKLKMQLWDSMCWPRVNPVPSGAVGKDYQRRLLSRSKVRQSCSATDFKRYLFKQLKLCCQNPKDQHRWN